MCIFIISKDFINRREHIQFFLRHPLFGHPKKGLSTPAIDNSMYICLINIKHLIYCTFFSVYV